MSRLTFSQRAFWVALVTAVAPYAFFRLILKPVAPFNAGFTISEDDLYDDLRDGEVAAAG